MVTASVGGKSRNSRGSNGGGRRDVNGNVIISPPSSPSDGGFSPSSVTSTAATADSLSMCEVQMLTGILRLSKTPVSDIMIPMQSVYKLSEDTVLDEKNLHGILQSGYSRVPIFESTHDHHVKGYLLIKSLVVLHPSKRVKVNELPLREPLFVRPNLGLLEMLNIFRNGQCHLAIVSSDPMASLTYLRDKREPDNSVKLLGIVTLEDVIERILMDDITDETDVLTNTNGRVSGATTTLSYHTWGQ